MIPFATALEGSHGPSLKDPMPLPSSYRKFIFGLLESKSIIPFPTTPLKDPTPLPPIGNSPWDGERIAIPCFRNP